MSAFDQDKFESFSSSLKDIAQLTQTIIAREGAVCNFRQPGSAKTYLFADGHTEIHSASDGNFEAWEKERLVAPPTP
jgi:prepilin-type processing-associated H-X9-DG protein